MIRLRLLLPGLIALCLSLPAPAQEPLPFAEENSPPVAVLTVSSINRLHENLSYLFGSIGRKEIGPQFGMLLAMTGTAQGIDRTKPVGAVVYLTPTLIPQPVFVPYAPVSDPAEWTKGLALIGMTVKTVADGRYELVSGNVTLFARLANGYVFVAEDETLLDRELPNPTVEFAGLATRYSLSLDIRPESVPEGQRELFRTLLRQNMQTSLLRRDDEPELDHRIRKAQALSLQSYAEFALSDLRTVTIGVDFSAEAKKAVAEVIVNVTPGSAAAETLQSITGRPTHFAPVIDDSAIVSLCLSLPISPENQQLFLAVVDQMQKSIVCSLCKIPEDAENYDLDADPIVLATAARLFDPVRNTIEQGHFDLLLQMYHSEEKKFSAVVGLFVIDAAGMDPAGRELIDRSFSESTPGNEGLQMQLEAADAGGVKLHRVFTALPASDDEAQRLVAGEVSVCFAFGNNAVWLGEGGPETGPRMAEMVSRAKDAGPAERGQIAPVRLTLQANEWLNFGSDDSETFILARQSFTPENDQLTLDLRPTDQGARLRLSADEGYVKLLAHLLVHNFTELFDIGPPEESEELRTPSPGNPS